MRSMVWWTLVGAVGAACGGRSQSEAPVVKAAGSGGDSSTGAECEPGGTRVCRRDDPPDIGESLAGSGGDSHPTLDPPDQAAGRAGAPSNAGSGNVAGTTAATRECYPPASTTLSDWVDVKRTAEEELAAVREHIENAWTGVVTTPWTPPYDVKVVFRDDGTYSARCIEHSDVCCEAFYYGTDQDCSLKRYSVDDATLSGNVTGSIDIAFGDSEQCSLPAWDGVLSNMDIDEGFRRLRFDFGTSDGYGPVHFELQAERPLSPK